MNEPGFPVIKPMNQFDWACLKNRSIFDHWSHMTAILPFFYITQSF